VGGRNVVNYDLKGKVLRKGEGLGIVLGSAKERVWNKLT